MKPMGKANKYQELLEKLAKTEKALDKACEELEKQCEELGHRYECGYWRADNWKEWCLRDEQATTK